MGVVVIHHTLLLPLLPPHTLPLLQCGVPPTGDSPPRTAPTWCPSHGLQLFMNCPSVGPFHRVQSFRNRLLQRGSPMGSQALTANLLQCGLLSSWAHRSCQEPAPVRAPLFMGPQVLPGACSSTGSSQGHSFLQASTCSSVGSSMGCRWRSAPSWTSMGCRGTACLTIVVFTGCRGISAVAPGAPPPSPSLTLVSAELLLSYSHSSLQLKLLLCSSFSPFLNVITKVLPPLLMGSALASSGSILELSGTGSVVPSSFSQKSPLWPPCYQNLATQTQYKTATKKKAKEREGLSMRFGGEKKKRTKK